MIVFLLVGTVFASALMAKTRTGKSESKSPSKRNGDGSPSKRPLKNFQVSGSKQMRKPNYLPKVEAVCGGNYEIYFGIKDILNDCYMNHLYTAIEEDPFWRNLGFILIARRRTSVDNDDFMVNSSDSYPRKVALRYVEDGVSTPESRTHILGLIRDFCMREENNRFSYKYIVDEFSDLTPENDDHYKCLDSYLQNVAILNVIRGLYEDAGPNWYNNNVEEAQLYWSGPTYPNMAIAELGYPQALASNNRGNDDDDDEVVED